MICLCLGAVLTVTLLLGLALRCYHMKKSGELKCFKLKKTSGTLSLTSEHHIGVEDVVVLKELGPTKPNSANDHKDSGLECEDNEVYGTFDGDRSNATETTTLDSSSAPISSSFRRVEVDVYENPRHDSTRESTIDTKDNVACAQTQKC